MNPAEPSLSPEMQSLRAKAEAGDREAQYEMGWRHALGNGFKEDEAEAVRWLTQAAEKGHLLAQNNLGARYYSGEGVARDLGEAYQWFHLAAEQGDRKASKNRDALTGRLTAEERARAEERIHQYRARQHGKI